jgi:hypothetical protein
MTVGPVICADPPWAVRALSLAAAGVGRGWRRRRTRSCSLATELVVFTVISPVNNFRLNTVAISLASFRLINGYRPNVLRRSFPLTVCFSRQVFAPFGVTSTDKPLRSKTL